MIGRIVTVPVDGAKMTDWPSFHREFQEAFGFPDYYGGNMDAWIDCMTYLDGVQSKIGVVDGDVVVMEILNHEEFYKNKDISTALHECAAFANGRCIEEGFPPRLMISVAL